MAPLIALAYKMKDIQLMNYLLNLKLDLSASCDKTTFINTICNDKNSKTSKRIIQKYNICTEQKSTIDEDVVKINIF